MTGRSDGTHPRGLFYLAVLGAIALAGYAYFGDLSPERSEMRSTVVLDGR